MPIFEELIEHLKNSAANALHHARFRIDGNSHQWVLRPEAAAHQGYIAQMNGIENYCAYAFAEVANQWKEMLAKVQLLSERLNLATIHTNSSNCTIASQATIIEIFQNSLVAQNELIAATLPPAAFPNDEIIKRNARVLQGFDSLEKHYKNIIAAKDQRIQKLESIIAEDINFSEMMPDIPASPTATQEQNTRSSSNATQEQNTRSSSNSTQDPVLRTNPMLKFTPRPIPVRMAELNTAAPAHAAAAAPYPKRMKNC